MRYKRKWSYLNTHYPAVNLTEFHILVLAVIPMEFQAQTIGSQTKSSGMFHFEGGWPKEINPKDEEATGRFRRRLEKDEDWAPKLRNLFQVC